MKILGISVSDDPGFPIMPTVLGFERLLVKARSPSILVAISGSREKRCAAVVLPALVFPNSITASLFNKLVAMSPA